MVQQPAVVIIARHGPRLDVANKAWHLSTPTPYDPPLTYGGWNQCRSLGSRIASLLDAREQSLNAQIGHEAAGVKSHDFAGSSTYTGKGDDETARAISKSRRKRVRHKIVIHSSPFLRCLQTSVAITAGIAEFGNGSDGPSTRRARSPRRAGSLRVRGGTSTHVTPKELRHRRNSNPKLKIDAFLGEWLNPQYFDSITPPPPSPMMLATAKAELMHNETVDIFTPISATTPNGNLWSNPSGNRSPTPESPLEDWGPVGDALPAPSHRRDRTSSHSSAASGGRKSPFRPGSALSPLTSTVPKPEPAAYHPPKPHYALSPSDPIPKGYVAHARNACTNVDSSWDSSRPPHGWGDGGQYGEEWSSMHKRFRRGFNHLIHWYSQHNSDDSTNGVTGSTRNFRLEVEDNEEEVQEELVVILVTHGAGCNALIGALTGQPVLLDVGMASLTMAVRKDDAPSIITYAASTAAEGSTPRSTSPAPEATIQPPRARRWSLDMGLSSVYEMKVVSSSEHLRPHVDKARSSRASRRAETMPSSDSLENFKERFQVPVGAGNTSAALGSIRRPSLGAGVSVSAPGSGRGSMEQVPTLHSGLWAPPAGRKSNLQTSTETLTSSAMNGSAHSHGTSATVTSQAVPNGDPESHAADSPENGPNSTEAAIEDDERPLSSASNEDDTLEDLPQPGEDVPQSLSRGLSQRGLWGARPSGVKVDRQGMQVPKRRWTVLQE